MARKRQSDLATGPLHKTLSAPAIYLVRMFVFLALVVLLAAILVLQKDSNLLASFKTNPLLNSLILGVLVFGILFAFRQVVRLYPEIRWVNAFRIADPGLASTFDPVLLAPMATMLRERTGALSLSTTSMRTIMDSIGTRLDGGVLLAGSPSIEKTMKKRTNATRKCEKGPAAMTSARCQRGFEP